MLLPAAASFRTTTHNSRNRSRNSSNSSSSGHNKKHTKYKQQQQRQQANFVHNNSHGNNNNNNNKNSDRQRDSEQCCNQRCACDCTLTAVGSVGSGRRGNQRGWHCARKWYSGRRWRRKRRKSQCNAAKSRSNSNSKITNKHSEPENAASNNTNISQQAIAATQTTTTTNIAVDISLTITNITTIKSDISRSGCVQSEQQCSRGQQATEDTEAEEEEVKAGKANFEGTTANYISCWMLPKANAIRKSIKTATTSIISIVKATQTPQPEILQQGKICKFKSSAEPTTQQQQIAPLEQRAIRQAPASIPKHDAHYRQQQQQQKLPQPLPQPQQQPQSVLVETEIAKQLPFHKQTTCDAATSITTANKITPLTPLSTIATKCSRRATLAAARRSSSGSGRGNSILLPWAIALFAVSCNALYVSTALVLPTNLSTQPSQVRLQQSQQQQQQFSINNISLNEQQSKHSMDVLNNSGGDSLHFTNSSHSSGTSSSSSGGSMDSMVSSDSNSTLKSFSIIDGSTAETEAKMNEMPTFDFGMPRNITARTGQTEAIIKCRVDRLDDKSVSWIRKRDLHILTVGTATYTSDKRFQVTESKDAREWTLHVKSPQARDSGIYECQVNTEPKVSMAFQLNIIEISPDSRAVISGPADLHFKVGSAIVLSCHVQQPSVKDIGPIYWYRGEHIITPFDADAVDAADGPSPSAGTGLTTTTAMQSQQQQQQQQPLPPNDDIATNDITQDFTTRIAMESQLGDTLKSRLRISNAQTTDTGNYTCQPTTASSASVMVHVINDENPAAMQKSSARSLHHCSVRALTITATATAATLITTLTLLLTTIAAITKTLRALTKQIFSRIAITIKSHRPCCFWIWLSTNCHQHKRQQQHQHQHQHQHHHQHPLQQRQQLHCYMPLWLFATLLDVAQVDNTNNDAVGTLVNIVAAAVILSPSGGDVGSASVIQSLTNSLAHAIRYVFFDNGRIILR